jgi:hypothetical protein
MAWSRVGALGAALVAAALALLVASASAETARMSRSDPEALLDRASLIQLALSNTERARVDAARPGEDDDEAEEDEPRSRRHEWRHHGRHARARFVRGDDAPAVYLDGSGHRFARLQAEPAPNQGGQTIIIKDENGIPWVTLGIIFLCVLVIAALCFIFRKHIPACVAFIEMVCEKAVRVALLPFKCLFWVAKKVTYPVKECIVTCYTRINHYYHPYLVVS